MQQTRQKDSKVARAVGLTSNENPNENHAPDNLDASYISAMTMGVYSGPVEAIIEQPNADWRGGNAFYEGPHDSFCFVCGSTMELFACQTCENCYHADCMSPSLESDEVPEFWFCPHCVDRELHISPSLVVMNDLSTNTIYPSPNSIAISPEKQSGPVDYGPTSSLEPSSTNSNPLNHVSVSPSVQSTALSVQPDEVHPAKSAAKSRWRPSDLGEVKKPGRTKTAYSPPRKKSKYSNFSIEVDKALSVLYSELEAAAQHGKSEDDLQSKVQDLEQTLKLQQGQMVLSGRELEAVRKKFTEQRGKTESLEAEIAGIRNEMKNLREQVQEKEAELKDWRAKLRMMMGSELE